MKETKNSETSFREDDTVVDVEPKILPKKTNKINKSSTSNAASKNIDKLSDWDIIKEKE